MIWYKHHMGSQTCVGGILNQTSNQLMHLLGETVTLGSFIPATTDFTATLYNTQGTPGAFSCSRDFLPAFSISIDSMRSTPSPEGFADPVSPSDGARSRSSTTKEDHKSGHKLSIGDAQIDENNFKYQNARSSVVVQAGTQKTNEDIRRQSPFQMQNTTASRHESGGATSSKSSLSLVLTNPEITEIDMSERDSSEEVTESPPLDCTSSGFHNMNEGEDKHLWDKEKANDETTESGSTLPGDETGGNGSSGGSLQASDNSEDSHGQQGTLMLPTTETNSGKGTTGESSTFLFIGPVGKKRRYCRDRQKSGDMEQDSPSSLPPPTPTGGGGDSLPDHFLGDPSPEHEESGETSGGSGSTSSVIRTVRAEQQQQPSMNTGGVITSTPTPVIRSVPSSRRREEQPLNLSLPSPSEAPSSKLPSPRRSESSVHVSVISMARRERDDIEWDLPQEVSSPGQSIYSGRSPRESSGGEQTQSTGRLSPLPCVTRDIHSISSSSASAFGVAGQVPNTFQGLLAAHGIVSPVSSRGGMSIAGNNVNPGPSGTQKRRLQCKDCGKEFSQLRNYRYHRSRHEGTQQFACTCPVCGKTFNDKGYLSSHLKIHRNAKEYKCEWCEKSFNQRVAYNMHVRIHTGHKPHKCPICPKAFSRKMLLRQHLRTHTGERPYKCEICGKAFADRSNMLLHQRLHSGQRPYKCDICGKSFSKNHHLKTHLNHHAGIKPYQCEKCKACFSQSSNMKTHFKKCTGVSNSSCTVTSGSFQQSSTGMIISSANSSTVIGSGGNQSLPSHSLPSPNTIPRYRMTEEAREELQLHQQQQQIQQQHRILTQQEQFQQLNPAQQQLLLRELTQNAAGGSSGLLGMPSHSSQSGPGPQSFANQINQVQSLGLNMGMLGLASPGPGRPRRGTTSSSGMTLIPMGSPSPTSLAAGHPLIPLASVENSGGMSAGMHTSTQGSIQTNPMLILSPRQHHTNIDLNAATLSQLQALTQQATSTQRRMLSSRLRMSQQQELNLLSLHQQQPQLGDSSISQLLSPPQRPSPQRGSPQRLISPRQTQSGSSMSTSDHYELVLPAFAVSRNLGSVHQSQVPFEQFAQPTRSHGHQHQIRGSGPGVNGNQHSHIQSSLLTVARTSASATVTSLQSDEDYFNAQDQPDYLDPNDPTRETLWRNRGAENSRYDDYKPM